MTDWKEAWGYRCKTRLTARLKKKFKRQNHRANRRAAKNLDTVYIRLNGWDVI